MLEVNLPPDEGKAGAQLDQQAGDVVDNGVFEGPFLGFVPEPEGVQAVGILAGPTGKVRQGRRRATRMRPFSSASQGP